ncbi:MAG TPA: hypothetical protein V6D22_25615 [Candidatus Obscuribacterales bacterium]
MASAKFEDILAVLGKRTDGTEFAELSKRLGKPVETATRTGKTFEFQEIGITLSARMIDWTFDTLLVQFKTFSASALSEIQGGDNRDTIEKKLGVAPISIAYPKSTPKDPSRPPGERSFTEEHCEKYDVPPYLYTFVFDSPTAPVSTLTIRRIK